MFPTPETARARGLSTFRFRRRLVLSILRAQRSLTEETSPQKRPIGPVKLVRRRRRGEKKKKRKDDGLFRLPLNSYSPLLKKPLAVLLDASRPQRGMCRSERSIQEGRERGKTGREGRKSGRGAREFEGFEKPPCGAASRRQRKVKSKETALFATLDFFPLSPMAAPPPPPPGGGGTPHFPSPHHVQQQQQQHMYQQMHVQQAQYHHHQQLYGYQVIQWEALDDDDLMALHRPPPRMLPPARSSARAFSQLLPGLDE